MKALLLSFRRGRFHQRTDHLLLEIEGCRSRPQAAQHIGSRVIWTTPGKRKIYGKIMGPHGTKGVLRARFTKSLPGDALAQNVEVVSKAKK